MFVEKEKAGQRKGKKGERIGKDTEVWKATQRQRENEEGRRGVDRKSMKQKKEGMENMRERERERERESELRNGASG